MTVDPFTAASATYQRAAGRGVRLLPLDRSGPVFPRLPRALLIVALLAAFGLTAWRLWL